MSGKLNYVTKRRKQVMSEQQTTITAKSFIKPTAATTIGIYSLLLLPRAGDASQDSM
jgi:hypothetical protein